MAYLLAQPRARACGALCRYPLRRLYPLSPGARHQLHRRHQGQPSI